MNLKELSTLLPKLLLKPRGVSIELMSAPGIGKSMLVADMVRQMGATTGDEWGFTTLFLATQTPPDLLGYQFKGAREWDGAEIAVTEPTLPPWMITSQGKPVWAYKHGILLLDEFGQGEADVKRASAELLLNHQIGPWKLPEGWSVIAASNRSEDRSGVTKSFDFVINRRVEINIQSDVRAWTEWAEKNDVMPLTIAFANQNPHIVFAGKVPDKQGPWCTPRSLVEADSNCRALMEGGVIPTGPTALEIVAGSIGDAAAAQYFAFVRLELELPKFEDVVARPTEVPVPEAPDAKMLVCYNLSHRVDESTADAVVTYVQRLPKEFAVTFASSAARRNNQLIKTKAFRDWAVKNASLMAMIS